MNIHTNPILRPAAATDARALAELINLAGEGIPEWLWARSCFEGQTPLEVGIDRARRTSGGFSFTNALIAEGGGDTLGMVLSYAINAAPEDDPDDLPDPIAPFVALEKLSVNTWYVNALAVTATARNRGVGTRLLAAAEAQAVAHGYAEMSIQVYAQNTGAARLYHRQGYRVVASAPVRLHPCPPFYTGDVLLLKKPVNG